MNILFLILFSALLLTGCKNSFDHMPDLTDDERKIIAQYAADIMIKHDKNNGKLVSDYEIQVFDEKEAQKQENLQALLAMKQTEEAKTDKKSEADGSVSVSGDEASDVKVFTSIEQVLGLEGISIIYNGFYVDDSYSDGGSDENFFALDATPGNKLLIVEFEAINNSSNDIIVDIFDSNVKFKVGINDEFPRLSMSTMLLDDMSMYKNTIPANSKSGMVLLREISPEEAGLIENISVEAVKDGITYYIQ